MKQQSGWAIAPCEVLANDPAVVTLVKLAFVDNNTRNILCSTACQDVVRMTITKSFMHMIAAQLTVGEH